MSKILEILEARKKKSVGVAASVPSMLSLHDKGLITLGSVDRSFIRLTAPKPDAPIENKIAFLRAFAARNDAITTAAGLAFDKQFSRSLKKKLDVGVAASVPVSECGEKDTRCETAATQRSELEQ